MKLSAVLTNSKTKESWDISTVISEITFKTALDGQPGTLIFTCIDVNQSNLFAEGSVIDIGIDGKGLFLGYLFKTETDSYNNVKVTAYDQMRYLKNKDFYIIDGGQTLNDVFTNCCNKFQLKSSVIAGSETIVSDKIHNDKTIYEIIQYAIDDVLVKTQKYYVVRDNYGTLELVDMGKLVTDYVIGDSSAMSEYTHSRSIDEACNVVKLIWGDKDAKTPKITVADDEKNVEQWGILQHYEVVNEGMNEAQITERANNLLFLLNRVEQTMKLTVVADETTYNSLLELRAGSGFRIRFNSALTGKVDQTVYVISCDTSITDGVVSSSMEVSMPE